MRPRTTRRLLTFTALAATALTALTGCSASAHHDASGSQDAGTGSPAATAGTSATPTPAPGPSSTVVSLPTGPTTRLTVSQQTSVGPIYVTTLKGAKSGVSGKVWVWLPPQYNDPKYKDYGFPVITLYSGGSSAGYNTYTDQRQLGVQAMDVALAKQGKASPFIMIMPIQNFHDSDWYLQDCSDIPGQPKMATWMGVDIPAFVRANFRTLRSRDGWGVTGASTGGFCSAKLALQFPQTFRAAVPVDGYFIPDSYYWRGHSKEQQANNPQLMVAGNTADIDMLVTIGSKEAYGKQVVTAFMNVARKNKPLHLSYYELPHGDHLTSDFKKVIPMTLEFFTQHLLPPTAG